MSEARPPDVSVRVLRVDGGTQLEFTALRRGVAPLRVTLVGGDALIQAREVLDRGLTRLKDELPGFDIGDEHLERVFQSLHRLGRTLLFTLFGLEQNVLQGLQTFWNRALPYGMNPTLPPPVVECAGGREGFLPLEFLPLFRMFPDEAVTTGDGFTAACRTLVGFSCVVRRALLPVPVHGGLALRTGPQGRVPARYLYYEHLEGAVEELEWFADAGKDHVDLEGPYPDGAERAPGLAEQIFDPRLLLDGTMRDLPDQVQHFACHCYTRSGDPLAAEIELSGAGRHSRTTLGDLGADLLALAASREQRTFDLPLVVMNACGSGRMRAPGAPSFPYLFLGNRNRGFIGTETEIPDDIAAVFSRALYERFLIRRIPLGRAVLESRLHLLHTLRNPLGLTYAAYADPGLHIRPTSEERPDAPAHP
ncbi:CHAT domain-containing protein [Streptomyces ipomoeae]|uniref:CHAT domain-containing protein n=1 Tax=Streptomyces ipomoeae TaxID=103232 RepID=UPI00114695AB|nr:CHAT domain-containing protein [Streptomyces ipomoeae]MDX2938399.1 CHAT domain-containing protein [Streptomyces ipomoeae]TQE23782.1 CHAT domain-containing protein [Streptomyces ipomoeae]